MKDQKFFKNKINRDNISPGPPVDSDRISPDPSKVKFVNDSSDRDQSPGLAFKMYKNELYKIDSNEDIDHSVQVDFED